MDDLVGYRVLGRQGELGVVIDENDLDSGPAATVTIRGGVSEALFYHVPAGMLLVSRDTRTAMIDVDVVDFLPLLRQDGTIELHLRP